MGSEMCIRDRYEPVHGSPPDIAGKNIANPIATILSLSMALKYSLDLDKEADQLEKAVQSVLDDGLRTKTEEVLGCAITASHLSWKFSL